MRYSAILVSALLLSSIYVISSSPSALAEEENVAVEAPDEVSAASGSNRFVVWEDSTPGKSDIMFRRSTDNGNTWKAVVNLSNNAGDSSDPQIAVSGANVYVVWSDNCNLSPPFVCKNPNYDIFLRRSTDNGATWKAVVDLSNNVGRSIVPQIAVSGSNVYVTWYDGTPGNDEIFIKRSTDNGATWKAVRNLSNNVAGSFFPQIAVSGSNVYVVWSDLTPGSPDIFLRRSTDNGATWKAKVNLSNNVADSEFPTGSVGPQVVVSGSNVYVVWIDIMVVYPDPGAPRDSVIIVRRSTDNGATWKAEVNLSGNGVFAVPQVVVSGSNVYVVWQNLNHGNGDIDIKRSTDNGATWKAVTNLSNNAGGSFDPQIAVSRSNVVVVWSDETPGNQDILFRRSTDNGATWNAVLKGGSKLSNNAGDSSSPQVAVSGSNVYVVWSDTTPGSPDILFRLGTDNGATWQPLTNLSMNSGNSDSPQVAG